MTIKKQNTSPSKKSLTDNNDLKNKMIHDGNILSRKIVEGLEKVKPGSIVEFNYEGKDVNTPRPLVLVLNTNYEGRLHAIKLSALNEKQLFDLSYLIRDDYIDKLEKNKNLDDDTKQEITKYRHARKHSKNYIDKNKKVVTNEAINYDKISNKISIHEKVDISSPKMFYDQVIKRFISTSTNCYRTYIIGGISNVKLIDYKFQGYDTIKSKLFN